jgi:hypothetical protein
MEGRGISFALPLIAAPEPEEAVDPQSDLGFLVIWEFALHAVEDLDWRLFVADRGFFNRIQNEIRHQVVFVRLLAGLRAKLRRRGLFVDDLERRDRPESIRPSGLHPPEPLPQECLVDAGHGAKPAAGIAIHGRITEQAERVGVKVLRVSLRDFMLSGELKQAYAETVKARLEGQASLERARGETAAIRHLLNATQLMEAHPGLIQLRYLQTIDQAGHRRGDGPRHRRRQHGAHALGAMGEAACA